MFRAIAKMLAPPCCIICNAEGAYLCTRCLSGLPASPHPCCFGCSRVDHLGLTCSVCSSLVAVKAHTVLASYDGATQELIKRLKFHRQRDIAALVARPLAGLLDASNYDVVTAIPAATNRRRVRGYNQAEEIAREVAKRLQLPYSSLFYRKRNARQVGSSRTQRLHQAASTFGLRYIKHDMRVLLIDDVMTTGATLNECAKLLVKQSGANVWVAVVAKAEH